MSMGDRMTVLAAAGAISATLGVGSHGRPMCALDDVNRQRNTRIDDVQADVRELRALVVNALKHGGPAD